VLIAVIELHFSTWKGQSSLMEVILARGIAPTQVVVIPFLGAAQSAIGLAKRSLGADSPEYFRDLVMNEKFGGAFTSRINLVLREEKGYTYGAHSGFQRARHAGMFAIMANVHGEATAPSIQEIFRELERLCSEPFDTIEYQEAVSGLLLGYPLRFESSGDTASQLATLPMYGRSPEFLSEWPRLIEEVSLEAARAAAKPYCDPRTFHIVVAGDATKVVPELEKLGLRTTVLTRPGADQKTSSEKAPLANGSSAP
jgi:zinc protease